MPSRTTPRAGDFVPGWNLTPARLAEPSLLPFSGGCFSIFLGLPRGLPVGAFFALGFFMVPVAVVVGLFFHVALNPVAGNFVGGSQLAFSSPSSSSSS